VSRIVIIDRLNANDARGWEAAFKRLYSEGVCAGFLEVCRPGTAGEEAIVEGKSWKDRYSEDLVKVGKGGLVLIHLTNDFAQEFLSRLDLTVTVLGTSGGEIPPWFRQARLDGRRFGFIRDHEKLGSWLERWKADRGTPLPWPGAGLEDQVADLLVRFAALDILVQGYLLIRQPDLLSPEVRPLLPFLNDERLRAEAERLTDVARLFRPASSSEADGAYWFDECRPDLLGRSPFDAETPALLERLGADREAGVVLDPGGTSIPSGQVREQAALRLVWELARAGSGATEEGVSLPDAWQQTRSQEDLTRLLADAHRQYWKVVEAVQDLG